jgi:hypothetical protein
MRLIAVCVAALLLSGCAETTMHAKQATAGSGAVSFSLFGSGGDATPRPKTIVVSNFILAQEVPVIDRGFSTRQESKGGNFPILERRARTAARVNDEIIATIVVALNDAGFDARPGSPDGVSLGDKAVIVKGRLRARDEKMPVERVGFGQGRGNVVADMTASAAGAFGNASAYSFSVALPNNVKLPKAKEAAAQNAAIAGVLTAADAAPEKLSPDVEAQARRLGLAIAEKLIAHAKEQRWLNKPEEGGAAKPAHESASESVSKSASRSASRSEPLSDADTEPGPQRVKLPAAKPAKKPAG